MLHTSRKSWLFKLFWDRIRFLFVVIILLKRHEDCFNFTLLYLSPHSAKKKILSIVVHYTLWFYLKLCCVFCPAAVHTLLIHQWYVDKVRISSLIVSPVISCLMLHVPDLKLGFLCELLILWFYTLRPVRSLWGPVEVCAWFVPIRIANQMLMPVCVSELRVKAATERKSVWSRPTKRQGWLLKASFLSTGPDSRIHFNNIFWNVTCPQYNRSKIISVMFYFKLLFFLEN